MDASIFYTTGLFWWLNDTFTLIGWKFIDLYLAALSYTFTKLLAPIFNDIAFFFFDLASTARGLDWWVRDLTGAINERLRQIDLPEQVRELSANIRYIMDDPGRGIREWIGEANNFEYWQYSTWDRLLYWMLHAHAHELWLFYIEPWEYIRDQFILYFRWGRDFLDSTEDWLRYLVGEALGLQPYEYATFSMIPESVMYRYFPLLYDFWRNPSGLVRELIGEANDFQYWQYSSWENLVYWMLHRYLHEVWLFYIDPEGYVFEKLDSYINRAFDTFAYWALNLAERVILYLW